MNKGEENKETTPLLSEKRDLYSWRSSKYLVIIVVFIAMMIELIMLTTLEPLLPDLLYKLHHNDSSMLVVDKSVNYTYLATTIEGGIIIGAKPGVEMIVNFIVGPFVDRVGHKWPMVCGCFGNVVATLGFAFAGKFVYLLVARIVQAVGSSLSVISAFALLSHSFEEGPVRDRMNSIAMLGLSFGMFIGFPFGSTVYYFLGRIAPFAIIAGLMLMDGALRLLVKSSPISGGSETGKQKFEKKGLKQYIKVCLDPYLFLILFCNILINAGLGVIVGTEPAWLKDTIHLEQWVVGMVLVGGSLLQITAQLIATSIMVYVHKSMILFAGMIVMGLGTMFYPFCHILWQAILTEMLMRVGFGLTLCAISPLLANVADSRHHSAYGSVFGLYGASYNFGLAVGPIVGGVFLHVIGFKWLYWTTAICLGVASLLALPLRNLIKFEKQIKPVDRRLSKIERRTVLSTSSINSWSASYGVHR